MLNALSSTLKNDSDDQSRKPPPTSPRAAAFSWMPRTARRIESTDVLGNVFESSRTKNEFSSAWCTRPRSASARKRSGTNERRAKYAIIAARWVPRSAKNFDRTRLTGLASLLRQYARRHGRGPRDRRPDRDLAAGPRGGGGRRERLARRVERRRRGARAAHRRRGEAPRRGRRGGSPGRRPDRGGHAARKRLRRPRRRTPDRCDDDAG